MKKPSNPNRIQQTDDKRFMCPECGQTFNDKKDAEAHLHMMHEQHLSTVHEEYHQGIHK